MKFKRSVNPFPYKRLQTYYQRLEPGQIDLIIVSLKNFVNYIFNKCVMVYVDTLFGLKGVSIGSNPPILRVMQTYFLK